jgi:hypothetical protein
MVKVWNGGEVSLQWYGVEWSGVVGDDSRELHGVRKEMSLSLVRHSHVLFRKAVSFC